VLLNIRLCKAFSSPQASVSQRSRGALPITDIELRLMTDEAETPVPWMTVPRAIAEIDQIISEATLDDKTLLHRYRQHLAVMLSD
jgi:hypothetical protein